MPEDPDELLEMTHPKVHTSDDIAPGYTTRAAFNAVWKDKGWKLSPTTAAPATTKKES